MQATTLAAVMRASDIHTAQGWAQGCTKMQRAMSSTEYQTSSLILKIDLADTLISSRFLRLPLPASLSPEQHEWPWGVWSAGQRYPARRFQLQNLGGAATCTQTRQRGSEPISAATRSDQPARLYCQTHRNLGHFPAWKYHHPAQCCDCRDPAATRDFGRHNFHGLAENRDVVLEGHHEQ